MQKIQLSELVSTKGLAAVSRALGVSPPAIHKAISVNRNIFVTVRDDGTWVAEEVRPFPSQKKTA
ncbi:Cro/CI family transcriptional regulator [Pseudomonas flexibilis]|uniref:Cro protein n=1 Tax=Pseudomonas flexibilis TaxID=706570 RepID=A0A1N6VZC9_9PSED|nr:Cro/CI family transcriptional regulator [Pseudomonas flexibilis]SIQ83237.1 Cro protein [Pseudomonas flexibilis]